MSISRNAGVRNEAVSGSLRGLRGGLVQRHHRDLSPAGRDKGSGDAPSHEDDGPGSGVARVPGPTPVVLRIRAGRMMWIRRKRR